MTSANLLEEEVPLEVAREFYRAVYSHVSSKTRQQRIYGIWEAYTRGERSFASIMSGVFGATGHDEVAYKEAAYVAIGNRNTTLGREVYFRAVKHLSAETEHLSTLTACMTAADDYDRTFTAELVGDIIHCGEADRLDDLVQAGVAFDEPFCLMVDETIDRLARESPGDAPKLRADWMRRRLATVGTPAASPDPTFGL